MRWGGGLNQLSGAGGLGNGQHVTTQGRAEAGAVRDKETAGPTGPLDV